MSNQHKYNGKPYRVSRSNGRPTQLYSRWMSMNGRCRDKGHTKHKFYGGRGVTVCQEWRESFDAFRTWAINNGFKKDLSLDRVDADTGYGPDNCQWITLAENRAKRRPRGKAIVDSGVLDDNV